MSELTKEQISLAKSLDLDVLLAAAAFKLGLTPEDVGALTSSPSAEEKPTFRPYVQEVLDAIDADARSAPSARECSADDARDAARYRHLREQDDFAYWLLEELQRCGYHELSMWQDHLDQAIDNDIKARASDLSAAVRWRKEQHDVSKD